ncbi:electron transfer flavoprotein subunit alpha/FixB family protein [Natronorarus salvus]|uniref:electron transfer flavoprotein subunit alpha/FixB family protein n=1 Tax=Natronorarus salvus TaxID=3117733 RepID=UPI002F264906
MVLALVEVGEGAVEEVSLETLTLARSVAEAEGEPLEAVAFADGASELVDELGGFGVSALHVVDHDLLDSYAPDAWAESLRELIDDRSPAAVLAPGTDRGMEVLVRLAARLGLPMAASCTAVEVGDVYEVRRQRWGGSLIEHATLDAPTALLSVAPHEVAAEPAPVEETTVERFTPELDEGDVEVRVVRRKESDAEGVPLPEARVVVGGGRGVGGAEGFDQLEELAELLGGTVGASRAAVNEGWRPHDDQIGQTGAKISPELYVAAGISGAVQHWVGCKGADHVLAINTDPEAAIVRKADWAVLADLHEVVPAIVEELRAERGG